MFRLLCLAAVHVYGGWNMKLAASTLTKIPGRSSNFEAFGTIGLAADANVIFLGHGSSGYFGLFSQSVPPGGDLIKLADNLTPIPPSVNSSSLETPFGYFILGSSLSAAHSRLAVFSGGTKDAQLSGIYFPDLRAIVTASTPVPGKPSGKFYQFRSPSHNNDENADGAIAFVGHFNVGDVEQEGVYLAKSADTVLSLADFDTKVPGREDKLFTMFTGTILENGLVVFFGSSFESALCTGHLHEDEETAQNCSITGKAAPWPGIFMHDGEKLSVLVDSTTVVSKATNGQEEEKFTGFSDPCFDGKVVAFVGATSGGRRGIWSYSLSDKKLVMIADVNTNVPGTSTPFGAFPQVPSIDLGIVVFYATVNRAPKNTGVYEAIQAGNKYELKKILTKGDVVEGYTVDFLQSSWDGYNGDAIAVQVSVKKGGKQVDGIIVGTRTP